MFIGKGSPAGALTESEIQNIVISGITEDQYVSKRVLVLTPDTPRTCLLSMMIHMLQDHIAQA